MTVDSSPARDYLRGIVDESSTSVAASCIRTLRLKVKPEAHSWLRLAAAEVNQVWNFANATSDKAARPFYGPRNYLGAFDLDKLTAGSSQYFERIGSETIQRVNAEYATRRTQARRSKLRWRKSFGSNRKGNSMRFSGRSIRVFERERLEGVSWKCGCFTEDSVGDWFLCLPVAYRVVRSVAPREDVGLDLGLKHTVATSDGEKLEAGHFYRHIEHKIAQAQRRGHKRQAKRLHRRAARRRRDALHKFSTKIVSQYQTIIVGDVSSRKLVKTRMAKSVLDAGWGLLKACSNCWALSGPKGLDMLDVRTWVCAKCGVTHDRDVNGAKNIRFAARCSPSICGNKSSPSTAPPSQASRLREARISAVNAAA
jgi:putative transposase